MGQETDTGKLLEEVVEHRRHLHKHPELSYRETATAAYISSVLDREGISHRPIAGTGILATLQGIGDLGRSVVLRADIDALPVREENESEFRSVNDGVMHACGHDFHTAALLGVLKKLNRMRDQFRGTVFGLFQPGEELNPGGATLVLAENPFRDYQITAFIGQHVDPELPTGTFGLRPGKYMASSDELRITIRGKGGHGAMPQKLRDPVPAAAAVITALQQVPARSGDPAVPTVLSIGKVVADGATNVIPDQVYMEGTFRTFDEEWRAEALEKIERIVRETAGAYGVEGITDVSRGYPCVVNSEELARRAAICLRELFGKDKVLDLELRTTAEDFGFYTRLYPALFYRVGVGGDSRYDAGSLHSPKFNPDENALRFAVEGMSRLALLFADSQ